MESLLRAKQNLKERRDQLRQELCADKPGGADRYDLRIHAACVPLDPQGKSKKAKMLPGRAATTREIAILEHEMEVRYPDPEKQYDPPWNNGVLMYAAHEFMEDMMSPYHRVKQPDPLLRFNEIAGVYKRSIGKGFKISDLPRHLILRALLSHLRSLIGGVSRRKRSSGSMQHGNP